MIVCLLPTFDEQAKTKSQNEECSHGYYTLYLYISLYVLGYYAKWKWKKYDVANKRLNGIFIRTIELWKIDFKPCIYVYIGTVK